MSDTAPDLRPASPGELDGLSLARLISRLGVDSSSPGLFLPESSGSLRSEWHDWVTATLVPVLVPCFAAVHRLAGGIRPAEIARLDRELDGQLPPLPRSRSLAAARAFLEGKSGMGGHREWSRYANLVTEGSAPGHLPVVFAVQTALFHLPLASSLAAYAWFELESGLPKSFRDEQGSGRFVLELFASTLPALQVAMRAEPDHLSGEAPKLKIV
jgi:urease accessory protein UreF